MAVAGAGGQRARAGVLEALDDGRLSAPIGPDDHGQRGIELDDLLEKQRLKSSSSSSGRDRGRQRYP